MTESEEELKSLSMKVKEKSEEAGLKLNIQKTKIMASSDHFVANKWEKNGNSDKLYFLGFQNHCRQWLQPWNEATCSLEVKLWQTSQCIEKQRHHFTDKSLCSQNYDFSSIHIQMWVCVCVCVSHFSHVWLFETLWTVAHQAPLPMGFSRQEYWSGLPCPPPGDLPDQGIKPVSHVSCIGRHVLYH